MTLRSAPADEPHTLMNQEERFKLQGHVQRSEHSNADCDPSQVFEQRLQSICGSIAAVELKCEASEERRQDAEEQLLVVTQRWQNSVLIELLFAG